MTPEQLCERVVEVLTALVADGAVVLWTRSRRRSWSSVRAARSTATTPTNVALQLAKRAGTDPRAFAELVAKRLGTAAGIAAVDIAGPGFLNITVEAGAQGALAGDIVAEGADYGANDTFAGERINLEFVSANPTGPLHLGGVRWAAVGDALGRVFAKSGAEVTREYYFNDHGVQIDRFARSLLASARGREVPDDGYGGQYIHDIAAAAVAKAPEALDLPDEQAQEVFREFGVELMFAEIKQSLHDFGVDFDVFFHEDHLHESGAVARAVERLTELGNVYEKDGAVWLSTEKFGDDKDRVIIKSDGQGAYLSGDLAYYLDKRERGFDRCFIMLGADHHGYVGRMMAMCAAFGDTPHVNLEILIGQMVNLLTHGEPLRMSKRAGTVVTIDDLVGAIGVDAARYALARYSTDSTIDIDLDILWAKRSSDNPVYYVQYVAARVSSLLRNAATSGSRRTPARLGPARATTRRASCCGRWRSSRASWPPPRSSGSRTGWPASSRTPRRSSPFLRRVPRAPAGRRGARRPPPRPADAGRGHPPGVRERPGSARRLGARAHVSARS